jgi:hypothetical protein
VNLVPLLLNCHLQQFVSDKSVVCNEADLGLMESCTVPDLPDRSKDALLYCQETARVQVMLLT